MGTVAPRPQVVVCGLAKSKRRWRHGGVGVVLWWREYGLMRWRRVELMQCRGDLVVEMARHLAMTLGQAVAKW